MSEDLPKQIGRYEIITLLGEGGMARVYLAVSRGPGGFNKLAVVKQILPQYAGDSDFVAMFLDEARLAARLHHPNIVQTFDVAEHDGNYALAMEYLEGQSLSAIYQRIHPRLLPIETHLWVLTQILTGLHYAHTLCDYDGTLLRVVHRDVNPANVLVTYGGEVKLLDFGVAKARGALAASTERSMKGKPAYCAPEQLLGGESDARADVFAAGVMLWEVLAGRRFNRSKGLIEAAKTRLSGKEPLIRQVCPDADPELAEICDRAMARDPGQRFASAAEFRIELQAQLDKRNLPGRRILVERMAEVFAADRRELAKLIETRLAERPTLKSSTPAAETQGVKALPWSPILAKPSTTLATPSKSTLIAVQTSTETSRMSTLTSRILFGTAIMAASLVGGFLIQSLRAAPSEAIEPQSISVAAPPQQPTRPKPMAPAVAPAAVLPEPKLVVPTEVVPSETVDMGGFASPPARLAGPESRAKTKRPRPFKSRRKLVSPAPTASTIAGAAIPSSMAARPPSDAPVPPAATSLTPGVARRPQASDQPSSTMQPGSHLLRPSVPVRSNVDEKDPYTP